MILIASTNTELANHWREALLPCYDVYEISVNEKHMLILRLKKVRIDVLIVDASLFEEQGINEIESILEIQPHLRIIIMVDKPDPREEISAILFGAKGYCSTHIEYSLLPKIVQNVLADELWVGEKFLSRLLIEIEDITKSRHKEAQRLDRGLASLTPRETQIASLVATGASNRKIAEKLGISERTVKAHLGVIFRKVGITDRLQLALYMNRHQELSSIWHVNQSSSLEPSLSSSSPKRKR